MKLKVLLLLFAVGQCVQFTKGLLERSIFKVIEVDKDGKYTVYDGDWTVYKVPEHALRSVEARYCDSIGDKKP